ncbi:MAG: MgtC/SapB family protein [Syntrophales bacterium]|nr:MgtC/SapB family protein [Syntrophales bacterium]
MTAEMLDFNFHEALWELAKLIIAALMGGAIGFERESHGQAAGIRTNLIVSLGACLMMMLSLHMEEIFRHLSASTTVRLDPGRIASYAIASMGFLGAGAIIKGRGSVRGLTTAAGLWLVTGIGLAVGAGYVFPALYCTVLSLVILYALRIKSLIPHDEYTILTLKFRDVHGHLEEIRKILFAYPAFHIQFVNFRQNISSQTTTYCLRLLSRKSKAWGELMKKFHELPEIEEITWEEGEVP